VMNLVSLLIAPAVVLWSTGADENTPLRIAIAAAATLIVVAAVAWSKRKPIAVSAGDETESAPSAAVTGSGTSKNDTPTTNSKDKVKT